MALLLLQPGIEPAGQFDLADSDYALVKGGEVGVFRALTPVTDLYAADVDVPGPAVHVKLDTAAAGAVYGLVDDGDEGYGTLFGSVIGMTAGQGTGFGAQPTVGSVVVGPKTVAGSGKASLWTKPGFYGVTEKAWESDVIFGGQTVNAPVHGAAANGTVDGKLTTTSASNGVAIGSALGLSDDTSLVSTTSVHAGGAKKVVFSVLYLYGVKAA